MSMQLEAVQSKINDLQEKILTAHPQMPILLREIHSTLKQFPEVTTLLSEEEISVIVSGLSKQTQTHLAGSVLKTSKTTSARKAMKTVSADDLGF